MNVLAGMLLNKYQHCEISTGKLMGLLIILLMVLSGPVHAQSNSRQVSYSHDQWPSRWSSAIHQQQTARFPVRNEVQTPLAELPEAVFEQDLFFSPSLRTRSDRDDRRNGYGKRYSKQHFSRNPGQYSRDAAFAYQTWYGTAPNYYFRSPYRYPLGASMPAMDPVLGFPGIGIPIMPGIPGAYPMNVIPFGVMPYGFPGNMTMWNPPFGAW